MPLPLLSGSTVLLSACFFLAFLRSPVTIGTTVAWICGVCSSMCSTAETVFVDSTMIPVCHNLRRYANKVFKGMQLIAILSRIGVFMEEAIYSCIAQTGSAAKMSFKTTFNVAKMKITSIF